MFWLAEQLGGVVLIVGGVIIGLQIFCHVFCWFADLVSEKR